MPNSDQTLQRRLSQHEQRDPRTAGEKLNPHDELQQRAGEHIARAF
jgi:hypothetical protein